VAQAGALEQPAGEPVVVAEEAGSPPQLRERSRQRQAAGDVAGADPLAAVAAKDDAAPGG